MLLLISITEGVSAILHTATLHKPHIVTHTPQEFVDINISGTLALLEAATANNVSAFIFTSTTSIFGNAMRPETGEPAVWISEDVVPVPKNIYGITKLAAENLCELTFKKEGVPCLVLRTSRFFPEDDDNKCSREAFENDNQVYQDRGWTMFPSLDRVYDNRLACEHLGW